MAFLIHSLRAKSCLLAGVVALWAAGHCNAQEELGIRLKTNKPVLTASPGVCELKNSKRNCTATIALTWEVPRTGDFCLYRLLSDKELACWQGKWSGVHTVKFESNRPEKFYLIRKTTNSIVAEAEVRIIGAIKQKVRAKRRSGIWRMF